MYQYAALIRRVIDGDTIVADIDLGFRVVLHEQYVRLYGINTPEMRGAEKEAGHAARSAVLKWLVSVNGAERVMEVVIETFKDKKGKYGRWLGLVFPHDYQLAGDGTHLNKWLVDNGYAERVDY